MSDRPQSEVVISCHVLPILSLPSYPDGPQPAINCNGCKKLATGVRNVDRRDDTETTHKTDNKQARGFTKRS